MNKVCSIFSQVLKLFSRGDFEKAVKQHQAERHARGFTSWGQFMAMLFCQLGRAHSLREICGGLACCEGQLKHLGVPVAPKKSTLAYANEHRPWGLYQTVFEQTLFKCQELVASQGGRKKFRFKNKLMSLDGSIIDLSVSMFDWAKFRRTKGAIKLHLLLDHDGYLPSFAVVTEGQTSEIKVARTLRFDGGTILAIDRGYVDYEWFRELTQQEVYFVTRMKEKALYEVKQELQVPQNSNVVRDQIVCFPRLAREGEDSVLFRRELVALIESGAADDLRLSGPELAVMAASHMGEDKHIRTLQAVFRRAGVSQSLLTCGSVGMPMDKVTAMRLAREHAVSGRQPPRASGS